MELREVYTDYFRCWFCGKMLLDRSCKEEINDKEVTFCSSRCYDFYRWYTMKRNELQK